MAYLVTGGIMELVFYLSIQADYQFAFLYSILDKFIAGVFGYIVYRFQTPRPTVPVHLLVVPCSGVSGSPKPRPGGPGNVTPVWSEK